VLFLSYSLVLSTKHQELPERLQIHCNASKRVRFTQCNAKLMEVVPSSVFVSESFQLSKITAKIIVHAHSIAVWLSVLLGDRVGT
jgi:hypothetical protein